MIIISDDVVQIQNTAFVSSRLLLTCHSGQQFQSHTTTSSGHIRDGLVGRSKHFQRGNRVLSSSSNGYDTSPRLLRCWVFSSKISTIIEWLDFKETGRSI
jgi:hypothetical protein